MIIVLNGYPGTGKLTIGRALATRLHGRLLDIHTIYNLAFALTEFRSPEFRAAVRQVEDIAHDLVRRRPVGEPIVLTTVLAGDKAIAHEEWARIVALGADRPPFISVHITCDEATNIARIQSPGRDAKRKPRDPEYVRRNHREAKPLLGADTPLFLQLDTSALTADASAETIARWVEAKTG